MQCNHINEPLYKTLIENGIEQEHALEQSRCSEDSVPGYTRCSEHGGGDLSEFYSRDMQPDEKLRFRELFNNTKERQNIPKDDLMQMNYLAMSCRQIILSHNCSPDEMYDNTMKSIQINRELAITPREKKSGKLDITVGKKVEESALQIEELVKQRTALTDRRE